MSEIQGEFSKRVGGTSKSKVRITTDTVVRGGREGPKYLGEAVVTGQGGKERKFGRLFAKTIDISDIDIEKVMAKYHWLKERGLPILPTFRFNKETNTLIATDLSRGGKRILVDRHHLLGGHGISPSQIQNLDELGRNIEDIASKAYDGGEGMELNDDNYMLVLDKTATGYQGELYLVDIGYGANFLNDLGTRDRRAASLETNKSWARIFMKEIQGLPI